MGLEAVRKICLQLPLRVPRLFGLHSHRYHLLMVIRPAFRDHGFD